MEVSLCGSTSVTAQRGCLAGIVFVLLAFSADALAQELACTDCHADSIMQKKHAGADLSCETCHGVSTSHKNDPSSPAELVFKKAEMEARDQPCLACHQGGARSHWSASAHSAADIACVNCHRSHTREDAMQRRSSAQQACLACHSRVKASLHQRARHPIKELKTTCTDCHASHGSLSVAGELKTANARQLCLECHKEKTGPYLFEHEPVTEDCGLCHKPHGSHHPGLLNSRPPFLCQQCHVAADHPGRLATNRGGRLDSNLSGRGCLNCHGAVHGSNHPSGAKLLK